MDGDQRLIAEVRATSYSLYPLDAIGDAKREQVRRLAGRLGVGRIDAVGIGLFPEFYIVHWERRSF